MLEGIITFLQGQQFNRLVYLETQNCEITVTVPMEKKAYIYGIENETSGLFVQWHDVDEHGVHCALCLVGVEL